eukprot:m.230362 g.230362  ORF g.230362 m.230362 type:complete len:277 (-) comp15999_c0_seq4:4967-5797(-)
MASQVAEKDRPEFLAGLLKGLRKHVARLERNEGKLYTENYAKLKQVGLEQLSSVACDNSNTYKNRYRNVLAYDSSRVVLEDGREGDYINANWVPGLTDPKRYIATQGPVPTTIIDFWSMIWQVQASIIVKVTREVENGVLKCHRYWPDPSSEPPQRLVLLGNVEVEFNSAEVHDTYIIRKFTLRKGSQQRSVQQFSYEAWPDHGVPLTTREFLDFRRIVKVCVSLHHCLCAHFIALHRCLLVGCAESVRWNKDSDGGTLQCWSGADWHVHHSRQGA